mmetsp:Transcript_29592/g.47760  ORF Transcript_29592/g.47760 Transcript_29592/m.47760 type:complete len:182 (-) Transcript_29592:318-863(-)
MSNVKPSGSLPFVPYQLHRRPIPPCNPPEKSSYVPPGYTGFIPGRRELDGVSYGELIRLVVPPPAEPGLSNFDDPVYTKRSFTRGTYIGPSPDAPQGTIARPYISPLASNPFERSFNEFPPIIGYSGNIPGAGEVFGQPSLLITRTPRTARTPRDVPVTRQTINPHYKYRTGLRTGYFDYD